MVSLMHQLLYLWGKCSPHTLDQWLGGSQSQSGQWRTEKSFPCQELNPSPLVVKPVSTNAIPTVSMQVHSSSCISTQNYCRRTLREGMTLSDLGGIILKCILRHKLEENIEVNGKIIGCEGVGWLQFRQDIIRRQALLNSLCCANTLNTTCTTRKMNW